MKITPKTRQAYDLMHEGTLALARAERQGIRVDVDYLKKKKKHLTRRIERAEEQILETDFGKQWKKSIKHGTKLNMDSDTQLANYLYKTLELKPTKQTERGKGSTDEEALLGLNIPELKDLIQVRKWKKMRDTYLEGFFREQVNGYIHPSFNLHLVTTYRSSSDRPNFQNIPSRNKELMKLTRDALFPRPGHQLLEVDYSGLEVAIAACYHKDPTMQTYIEDPTTDMHGDMAAQIYKIDHFDRSIPEHYHLRAGAKNGFVFPQFYGDYYKNCAESLACNWGELPHGKFIYGAGVLVGDEDRTLGKHLIGKGIHDYDMFEEHIRKIEDDFWGNRFKVYAKWKDEWWAAYQEKGYIEMKTGFQCSSIMSRNDCINYPVQGAAFHCLLWSFIELDRIMRRDNWDTRLIGQIHDAIILDVNPKELEKVIKAIKNVTTIALPKAWDWITVPLSIDGELCGVDRPWSEKKEIKI